jgi:hypothetical protein
VGQGGQVRGHQGGMTGRVGSRVIRPDGNHRGHRSHCEETDLTRQTALVHQGWPQGSLKWAKPRARSTISVAPPFIRSQWARQPRVWAVSGGGGASEPHRFRPPPDTDGMTDGNHRGQLPSPRRASPVAAGFAPQSGALLGSAKRIRVSAVAQERTVGRRPVNDLRARRI